MSPRREVHDDIDSLEERLPVTELCQVAGSRIRSIVRRAYDLYNVVTRCGESSGQTTSDKPVGSRYQYAQASPPRLDPHPQCFRDRRAVRCATVHAISIPEN